MVMWHELSHLPNFDIVISGVEEATSFLRYRFGYAEFPFGMSGYEFRTAFNEIMGTDVGSFRIPQFVSKVRYEAFDDIMA